VREQQDKCLYDKARRVRRPSGIPKAELKSTVLGSGQPPGNDELMFARLPARRYNRDVIARVRNATSAELDSVEEGIQTALPALLEVLPAGNTPKLTGEVIDQVTRKTGLDRSVVQMALTALVAGGTFLLNNRFEVTRVR